MSTVTFYRAVMKAAGTDDRALAKRATAAVCHALRDRLTPEEADQAVAQRPLELKEVWEEGTRGSPAPEARPCRVPRACGPDHDNQLREERPVCTGHTEACWARNRRAHFLAKAADRRS